jgi:hypothetical protein
LHILLRLIILLDIRISCGLCAAVQRATGLGVPHSNPPLARPRGSPVCSSSDSEIRPRLTREGLLAAISSAPSSCGSSVQHQRCNNELTNLPTEPPAHPPRCGAIDRAWLAAPAVSPGKGRSLRCGTPLSSASSCCTSMLPSIARGVGGFVALALAACIARACAAMRHSHHAPGLSDSRMHAPCRLHA